MSRPIGNASDRMIVVDDDATVAEFITKVAHNCGYDTRVALSLSALKQIYADFPPTVIALDLTMPEADGIEVMTWLAEVGCPARVVLLSGAAPELLEAARRLGRALGLDMAGALSKPFGLGPLTALLRKLARSVP
jgi:CheY-like chemotaxis protein